MDYRINVDCGSMFTDGFLIYGNEQIPVKVLTTPHDLMDCFSAILNNLAEIVGLPLHDLLANTSSVCFSAALATNIIQQRSGSKLGLILTQGSKKSYLSRSCAVERGFIKEEMIEEVEEEVDASGNVVREPSDDRVLKVVEHLFDDGARCIVVGFTNAIINPSNERAFRTIVDQYYPKHFLGAVPLLLSSEISIRTDDLIRINTALMNAYLHRDMARFLYKAEEYARRACYSQALLVGLGSGGVARVAKTTALATYNSSAAAGVMEASRIAALYKIEKLLTADMGGTSLDASLLVGGTPRFLNQVDIEGLKCYVLATAVNSIGAGGGSVAFLKNSRLTVGPASAGSYPGPACFKNGGIEPTVTDAGLVLGMLNGERFLGGRIKLYKEAAIQSIKEYIARPLGLSVEEAAWHIRTAVEDKIAALLKDMLQQEKVPAEETTLMAFGGAGPAHCCFFAEKAGIYKIIVCQRTTVLSAFGLAKSCITRYAEIPGKNREFKPAVEQAKAKMFQDMRTEGFSGEQVNYHLWPIVKKQNFTERVLLGDRIVFSQDLEEVLLEASVEELSWKPVIYANDVEDCSNALTSWRSVYWGEGYVGTPIFNREQLKAGHRISGPAIIEADDTTYVIPDKWRLFVDKYANVFLSKEV